MISRSIKVAMYPTVASDTSAARVCTGQITPHTTITAPITAPIGERSGLVVIAGVDTHKDTHHAAVITATTPLIASAAWVSTDFTSAWAWGERTKAA